MSFVLDRGREEGGGAVAELRLPSFDSGLQCTGAERRLRGYNLVGDICGHVVQLLHGDDGNARV